MAEPFDTAGLGMNASPTTRRAALAVLAAPLAARSAVNTDGIADVITLAAEKNGFHAWRHGTLVEAGTHCT